MRYKELLLIDYIKAVSCNLVIPTNILNHKLRWLYMCDNFVDECIFCSDDKVKVKRLMTSIRYATF